jgi:hypothetical protein
MSVTSFYNICGMEEDTTRCVLLPPCVQHVAYDEVALGPPFECGDALQPPLWFRSLLSMIPPHMIDATFLVCVHGITGMK